FRLCHVLIFQQGPPFVKLKFQHARMRSPHRPVKCAPYTTLRFHHPRLNSTALRIASSENARVIAQNTPSGPAPVWWASHQATGSSNSQNTITLSHVGVHVSPAPLNDWV